MADLVGSRPWLEPGGGTAPEGGCAAIDGSVWSAWAGHEQPAQGWAVSVRYMATVSGIALAEVARVAVDMYYISV